MKITIAVFLFLREMHEKGVCFVQKVLENFVRGFYI